MFKNEEYFQLSNDDFLNWRSQIVTSNSDKQGLRRPPFAFTKYGVEILKTLFKKDDQITILSDLLDDFHDKEKDFSMKIRFPSEFYEKQRNFASPKVVQDHCWSILGAYGAQKITLRTHNYISLTKNNDHFLRQTVGRP